MEKFSIIMPCHNGEKFIGQAIESVIAQTYTEWELLIVDDNSTDNSLSIIKEFSEKDSRIKCFQVSESVGNPSAPRNLGIENATGRFIAFLDCDDLWMPSKLADQVALFDDENVSVVYSWYEKIAENGERSDRLIKSKATVNYKQLLRSNCIGNLTGVYDVSKVGKVYQVNQNMEDYIMWLDVLKKGGYAKNTCTLEAMYRISSSSLSSSKLKHFKWQWNVYRKHEKLGLIKSACLYCCYAVKGFIKYLK